MLRTVERVGQEEHRNVEFDFQELTEKPVREVEAFGVAPDEMQGHDGTAVRHAFGDEGLGPGEILDPALDPAGTHPGREDHELVLGGESLVEKLRQVARLPAHLVDRRAEGRQRLEKQQEIVDRHSHLTEVVGNQAAQGQAVRPAQRMIGSEGVTRPVGGNPFQALHLDLDIHLGKRVITELHPLDPVLVHEALEKAHDKTGDILPLEFGSDNAIQVNQEILLIVICHFRSVLALTNLSAKPQKCKYYCTSATRSYSSAATMRTRIMSPICNDLSG